MANISNILNSDPFMGVPSQSTTPTAQLEPLTTTAEKVNNVVVISISPSGRSSSAGNVIPVPSQVPTSSSSPKEEEQSNSFVRHGIACAGQTENGERTYPDGVTYKGPLKNGLPHGEGTLSYPNGTILYQGGFQNSVFHGEGTLFFPDRTFYKGGFQNGLFHGQGKRIYNDKSVYEGSFEYGMCHGKKGRVTHPDGTIYEGGFINGQPYGPARIITADGVREGQFDENDILIGSAMVTNADGEVFLSE